MSSHAVAVAPSTVLKSSMQELSEDSVLRLAHDLRQPLSTIEAIAYYLELTLPAHQLEARRYLARLRETVEESNSILSNALEESRSR